jgi:osmotically-inducible protein OsmY
MTMDMSDEDLKELVEERLNNDPTIDVEGIEVKTQLGFVNLYGHVETRDDRKWVEVVVRQIPQVKDVFNYLTLEPKGIVGDQNLDQNMI